jgi:3-hydroxyisobutyrate dehydrogenase
MATRDENAARPRAGLIGVGRMGGVMLRCLLERGFEVDAFDPRPEALSAFVGEPGLHRARDARQVAERADVVGIVVFDDDQLMDALDGPRGALTCEGAPPVVMIHSTVTLDTVQRAGVAARRRGAALLDAAVSGGTTEQQEKGELCLMIGGDAEFLARARPVLEAYSTLIVHAGPLGSGMDAKLVRNHAAFTQVAAIHEALRFGRAAGIDDAVSLQILEHTLVLSPNTRATLEVLARGAATSTSDAAARALASYVRNVAHKDLTAVRERAADIDAEVPIAAASDAEITGAFARRDD